MAKKDDNWTSEEIEFLKEKFQNWSAISISLRLRKSVNAVRCKSSELGLKRQLPPPWTMQELEIVKQYYPIEGPKKILKRLPGRTIYAIKHVAKRYGIKFIQNPTPQKQLIVNVPISTMPQEWDGSMQFAVCGKWC